MAFFLSHAAPKGPLHKRLREHELKDAVQNEPGPKRPDPSSSSTDVAGNAASHDAPTRPLQCREQLAALVGAGFSEIAWRWPGRSPWRSTA